MKLLWKASILLALLSAMAVFITGCGQKPIAKVDGTEITADAYMSEMERQPLPQRTRNFGEMILDGLVTKAVILSEAEKQKVMPSEKEISDYVAIMRFNPGFDQMMKESGKSGEILKEEAKLTLAEINLYTKGVKVDKKEVETLYNEQKSQYPYTVPPFVSWSGIIVATPQEAETVRKMLEQGADFALVAQQKSLDPSSKAKGGEMPDIPLIDLMPGMPPDLVKVLKTVAMGGYSAPVAIQGRYAIIKIRKRTEARQMSRNLAEFKIRMDLLNKKAEGKQKPFSEFLQGLKDKAKVEIYRDSVKNALVKETAPK